MPPRFAPKAFHIPALVVVIVVAWIGRRLHRRFDGERPIQFYFWIFRDRL